jgi:hypothetical protein
MSIGCFAHVQKKWLASCHVPSILDRRYLAAQEALDRALDGSMAVLRACLTGQGPGLELPTGRD